MAMRLDRNVVGGNGVKVGKFAVVALRKVVGHPERDRIEAMLEYLALEGVLECGAPESEHEFFVIKLKDMFAHPALLAYAEAARFYDPDYAEDVERLALRAGRLSRWGKIPD